jgi:hypothetical protein
VDNYEGNRDRRPEQHKKEQPMPIPKPPIALPWAAAAMLRLTPELSRAAKQLRPE